MQVLIPIDIGRLIAINGSSYLFLIELAKGKERQKMRNDMKYFIWLML
jgi:hypothetical protein